MYSTLWWVRQPEESKNVQYIVAHVCPLAYPAECHSFSAVQLGHLGQRVSEAKKAYAGIVAESASFPRDPEKAKFDPRRLEESVGMLLERTCSRGHQKLLSGKGNCHINTKVCNSIVNNHSHPLGRIFGLLLARAVWSIAQQPTKTGHHEADLINHILDEAVRLFPEREIACLVCIGTDGAPFPDAAKYLTAKRPWCSRDSKRTVCTFDSLLMMTVFSKILHQENGRSKCAFLRTSICANMTYPNTSMKLLLY